MKIVLKIPGEAQRKAAPPFEGADHALVDGACPKCGDKAFAVQGKNMHITPDDRAYEADAVCCACKVRVGTLRAEPSTIFGLHEDEAVLLRSRCRVY